MAYIEEGFDCLGFNLRQYKANKGMKLPIKPSKASIKKAKDTIRNVFKRMRGRPGWTLCQLGTVTPKLPSTTSNIAWEIWRRKRFTKLEPGIAIRQLERIEKAILSLDEMPNRFKTFENEPWYSRGLHKMPADNFIVFYIPNIADKIVTITRVMYGGRDKDIKIDFCYYCWSELDGSKICPSCGKELVL